MGVRIIRQFIPSGKETVAAGYGAIPLPMAIQFLDFVSEEYAKENRCAVRRANRDLGDKIHHERIVSENGQDMVRFFLRFS